MECDLPTTQDTPFDVSWAYYTLPFLLHNVSTHLAVCGESLGMLGWLSCPVVVIIRVSKK
jgi:hypothetical protein